MTNLKEAEMIVMRLSLQIWGILTIVLIGALTQCGPIDPKD